MSNPIKMVAGFLTVGMWTLISRIAGLAREIVFAALLGTSAAGEAFLVAFSLPNMFRRFFAEGAFNMAFVPMFAKRLQAEEDAQGFASDAFAALASILVVLTLVATLFMPWLVLAMAAGFRGDERFDLAVDYGRLCFPYILLISLAALFSGVLNAAGKFAVAAAAPVFLNFVLIASMAVAHFAGLDPGTSLSVATPIAGIVQLTLVWIAAEKMGIKIRPKMPRFTPEMKQLAKIAAPAALAGGVFQINLLVGRQVASLTDGAIAWLAYADRLVQLPLGVVGIAIGIVLLPALSRRIKDNDAQGGQDAFNRAWEFSLFLTLPAAAALIVVGLPMISVLFERGAFLRSDSLAAASAVAIYAVGLPAFVLQKVLQPLYFARENTKSPFHFALVAMVVNAVLAFGLYPWIGYLAAAIGTSVASWAMVLLLWYKSRDMGDAANLTQSVKSRSWRILLASFAMGAVLWFLGQLMENMLIADGVRYFALIILTLVGAVSYFGFAKLLGILDDFDLKSALKR